MILVRRKAHFSAAHRLYNPEKSDAWNKETFGKCSHEHWHGHNYKLEVTVAGTPDEETGMLIDFADLKQIMKRKIVDACDHKNLNLDVPFLEDIIPSTENLAEVFFAQLKDPIKEASASSGFLYAVKLRETERNTAIYCPYLFDDEI